MYIKRVFWFGLVVALTLLLHNEPPKHTVAFPAVKKQDTPTVKVETPKPSNGYSQPQTAKVTKVTPPETTPAPVNAGDPKAVAQQLAAQKGWTGYQWQALLQLWQNESGWDPNAYNVKSGACGIPQALPCEKIPNWRDVSSQINWGLDYVAGYGSPSEALRFWHCIGSCYSTRTKTTIYKGATWY